MIPGLPPNVDPPDAPQPDASGEWFPHVLDQRVDADGTVLVTFAAAPLTRMTIRVPFGEWVNGEHFAVVQMPDELRTVLFPPSAAPVHDDRQRRNDQP